MSGSQVRQEISICYRASRPRFAAADRTPIEKPSSFACSVLPLTSLRKGFRKAAQHRALELHDTGLTSRQATSEPTGYKETGPERVVPCDNLHTQNASWCAMMVLQSNHPRSRALASGGQAAGKP
jgi:hypothetical protein